MLLAIGGVSDSELMALAGEKLGYSVRPGRGAREKAQINFSSGISCHRTHGKEEGSGSQRDEN